MGLLGTVWGIYHALVAIGVSGQAALERVPGNLVEAGQAGGHRHRAAGQGTGLIHGAQRGDLLHDVATAAEGAHRHAAADHLAERREIRRDAVVTLRALRPDAETGHHFVEDQHRAVLRA